MNVPEVQTPVDATVNDPIIRADVLGSQEQALQTTEAGTTYEGMVQRELRVKEFIDGLKTAYDHGRNAILEVLKAGNGSKQPLMEAIYAIRTAVSEIGVLRNTILSKTTGEVRSLFAQYAGELQDELRPFLIDMEDRLEAEVPDSTSSEVA